jgi:hypothetical protein
MTNMPHSVLVSALISRAIAPALVFIVWTVLINVSDGLPNMVFNILGLCVFAYTLRPCWPYARELYRRRYQQ